MEVGGRDTLEVSGGKRYPRGRRAMRAGYPGGLEVGVELDRRGKIP